MNEFKNSKEMFQAYETLNNDNVGDFVHHSKLLVLKLQNTLRKRNAYVKRLKKENEELKSKLKTAYITAKNDFELQNEN